VSRNDAWLGNVRDDALLMRFFCAENALRFNSMPMGCNNLLRFLVEDRKNGVDDFTSSL
jgi:hypothetical protein